MHYETLTHKQDEAVLTITVNRPEALNAQSRLMLEEFDQALAAAAEDESVKVIIVAGAGKHFSAGHDIGTPQCVSRPMTATSQPLAPCQYRLCLSAPCRPRPASPSNSCCYRVCRIWPWPCRPIAGRPGLLRQ